MGENPILSQVLRKGFLEVDKLKRMLSVRLEEVVRYFEGLSGGGDFLWVNADSRLWDHLDRLRSLEVLSL